MYNRQEHVRFNKCAVSFIAGVLIAMRFAYKGFSSAPDGYLDPTAIVMLWAMLRFPGDRLNHALSVGLGMTVGFFTFRMANYVIGPDLLDYHP